MKELVLTCFSSLYVYVSLVSKPKGGKWYLCLDFVFIYVRPYKKPV